MEIIPFLTKHLRHENIKLNLKGYFQRIICLKNTPGFLFSVSQLYIPNLRPEAWYLQGNGATKSIVTFTPIISKKQAFIFFRKLFFAFNRFSVYKLASFFDSKYFS